MSKLIALFSLLVAMSLMSFSNSSDLFISEYHEGAGNNKWIEIFNGTGTSIDLSDYSILYEGNYSSSDPADYGSELQLSGFLDNNDVLVIAKNGADDSVLPFIDEEWFTLSMTGDDPIALAKNGIPIDVIGYPYRSSDPENASSFHWPVGSNILDEARIIRKATVMGPNDDWASSSGNGNDNDSEWIWNEVSIDISDLGQHTIFIPDDSNVDKIKYHGFYDKGFTGCDHPKISFGLYDNNDELITEISGVNVKLELIDETGSVIESFSSAVNEGALEFKGLRFTNAGNFQVRANYNGLLSELREISILKAPKFNELMVPQYVIGVKDSENSVKIMPAWALFEITGLHSSTTYNYTNGLFPVDFYMDNELLQNSNLFFGQIMTYDQSLDEFIKVTDEPSLSSDNNCNNKITRNYSTMISDEKGHAKIWINTFAEINAEQDLNQFWKLWWVFELGFENSLGRIMKYQTENSSNQVFIGKVDHGERYAGGIIDYSSELQQKTIISLWSEKSADPARPVVISMVQDDGAIWQKPKNDLESCEIEGYYDNEFVPFYKEISGFYNLNNIESGWGEVESIEDGLDRAWATYYPYYFQQNQGFAIPSNITGIKTWDFYSKEEQLDFVDLDGTWGNINSTISNIETNENEDFTLLNFNTPFLELTSFQIPDEYCNNGELLITWKAQGIESVSINILVDGQIAKTIAENIPAINNQNKNHDQGFVELTIDRDEFSGEIIQIEIRSDELVNGLSDLSNELMIIDPPKVQSVSGSELGCYGEQSELVVDAVGTNLIYQWYKDGELLENEFDHVLRIENLNHSNSGVYVCEIKNKDSEKCESVFTDEMILYVSNNTEIINHPSSKYSMIGMDVEFTFDSHIQGIPENNNDVDIQWYKGDIVLKDNNRISGSRSNRLTIRNIQESDFSDTDDYYASISGVCGEVFTNMASLKKTNIQIVEQPKSQVVCSQNDFSLNYNIDETGFSGITYQWFFNGEKLVESTRVKGVNSNKLEIFNSNINFQGVYNCKTIIDEKYELSSMQAKISILDIPNITKDLSQKHELQKGDILELAVEANSFTPLNYKWFKSGEPLANQSSSSILLTGNDDTEGSYFCRILNDCGFVDSKIATVAVAKNDIDLSEKSVSENDFILFSPVPNIVSENTRVEFFLPKQIRVNLKLVTQTGRNLILIKNRLYAKGYQFINLNINELGLGAGMYFILLESGELQLTQRLIVGS